MNFFIFVGLVFLCTFVLGHILEKMRIPWIFAPLILGVGLSGFNPFVDITGSAEFTLFSQIGLYLLLFLIGFELDVQQIIKSGKFIIKATFIIEILEMLLVGTGLHLLFGLSWVLSFLVALSFATVGEAILLPMLEELDLVKTKLGQTILGIATFDDIFELITLFSIIFIAPFIVGAKIGRQLYNPLLIKSLFLLVCLLIFILLTIKWIKKGVNLMNIPNIATVLPLILSVFFIFTGIDQSSEKDIAVLGALFAGIIVKNLLPTHRTEEVEPQIKAITYGLFAPIFFLGIGLDTNINYLLANFWLIIVITLLAKFAKIFGSYIVGHKELGTKPSIFMGVALGVRFSTSLVFLKILLDNHLIEKSIYSVLIGTSIIFKFIIPLMLSGMARKWHIAKSAS